MELFNVEKKSTHIARDEGGSLDEGAADVEEVPESRPRQVTEGHTDIQKVSQTLSVGLSQQYNTSKM